MTDTHRELEQKLAAAVSGFEREIKGIRTGRPSPALIEDVKVSYYDQTLPLKQIGSITVAPPRDLLVQVWDAAAVSAVAKAIESSPLGLSASTEGNVVRLRLPELSHERREELIRHVRRIFEQYRIQVRQIRDEANKEIQRQFEVKELGEDQRFKMRETIQKSTDAANASLDSHLERKVAEIEE